MNQSAQSPEQFQKEVEDLKARYQLNKPNLWEGNNSNTDNTDVKH